MEYPKMEELLSRKEPLHEALVPYLQQSETSGMMFLRHPLVFDVPYSPIKNALNNHRYLMLKEHTQHCLDTGKYDQYVWAHERPYRFEAYMNVRELVSDNLRAELLASVWGDSENIWQNLASWQEEWQWMRDAGRTPYLGSPETTARLMRMPREVQIWRGQSGDRNWVGLSWTTDKDKAVWFARRFSRASEPSRLIAGMVRKEHILALFDDRNESEVVAFPDDVTVLISTEVTK